MGAVTNALTKNVYANSADLANGKATLGNTGYNYIDTSAPGYIAPTSFAGSLILGGTGATGGIGANVDTTGATRLAGVDRGATQQAIADYATQKANTPTVTDNSSQISDMYAQQLASSQASLKAAIASSQAGYQDTINNAPATYAPMENEASAKGQANLQNVKEMLANGGQAGGVNRTEETQVNAATENNINALETQKQGVINTAQKAIADLQAQGDLKGAQLVADNANAKLSALIAESNRVQTDSNNLIQQKFSNDVTTKTLANQTLSTNADVANKNANTLSTTIQNQYLPAEEEAKIKGLSLQNAYQQLQNDGFPAQQAADLASKYASVNASNASASSSIMNANTSASNSAWAKDPSNPDNQYKKAQIAALSAKPSADLVGQATSYVMQQIYGNNDSSKSALASLTSHKGSILAGLTKAGMSAKDAMAYYTSVETDLNTQIAKK